MTDNFSIPKTWLITLIESSFPSLSTQTKTGINPHKNPGIIIWSFSPGSRVKS